MLNKDICKRCMNKHRLNLIWDDYDDDQWINGLIYCPRKYSGIVTSANDNLPEHCTYSLEHIISMDSKINAQ